MATIDPASLTTTKAGKPRPTKIGVVESDKRDKTRRVVVGSMAPHPKYGKFVRRRTVLHVHDEKNESRKGDMVEIAECRPISKTKAWALVRIVNRSGKLEHTS